MDTVKKSIVKSLDGLEFGLFPYLSYLLQDLWEFGASPDIIIDIIKRHNILHKNSKVLDLGCGKGAVLIKLVKEFGCRGHGMDALPDFIQEAKAYADKNKVAQKCTFETGDIRRMIDQFRGYDLVILGSIGPVFGDIKTTLQKVQVCIKKKGYVVLDDGYISKNSTLNSMVYMKETEALQNIEAAKMESVDMTKINTDFIKKSNKNIYDRIHKRAIELMHKHPEHQYLFEGYLKSQEEENAILENDITCITWLLRKQD